MIYFDFHYLYCAEKHQIEYISSKYCDLDELENVLVANIDCRKEISMLPVDKTEVMRRYSHGDITVVARIKGELAGVIWSHRGDCHIKGLGITLNCGNDGVYFYNLLVFPKFRRSRIMSKMMNEYSSHCLKKGIIKMYAFVMVSNHEMNSYMKRYFVKKSIIFSLSVFRLRMGIDYCFESKKLKIYFTRNENSEIYCI